MSENYIFHLAFPIKNLIDTKKFYVEGLGCTVGRETVASIILGLYGHQLVGHLTKEDIKPPKSIYPRHFGIIFRKEKHWEELLKRAKEKGLKFFEEEKDRFVGKVTEHRSFFLEDPFHNLLEFKFYRHESAIFGNAEIAEIGDASAEDI
jgi:extradiol dioxygenase family protein